MMPSLPEFVDFFHAVHGRTPLPWQMRLAERVAAARRWPSEVVVPNGAEKLACLDIAVWCLALEAGRLGSERELPTRIWWVSDEFGTGAVADRLRLLCGGTDGVPLEVIDLGSGCSMPSDPARPAVILCSLPMYGSRLLFRGYGARWPALDAAMAGMDSLVLVDEARAAGRLSGLLAALGECCAGALPLLPGARQAATVVGVLEDASAGAAGDDVVRMPEVLPGVLWEWVKTTTPPEGEAPVEPYFMGIGGGGLGPAGEGYLYPRSERVRSQVALALDHLEALGEAAAERARRVAQCLGLPPALCETVAFAAQVKDLGMADARFQRSFGDGHSAVGAEGWPNGGRYEALSARLVSAWLDRRPEWGEPVERDLLVHLVASHRGAGRPLVVPVRDSSAGTVCARVAGVDVEVGADLAETDWEQPARFRRLNRRFGPWGAGFVGGHCCLFRRGGREGVRLADVSSTQIVCDGLPAGWLNGWMAALGATVLDEGVRLRWEPGSYRAVLSATCGDPVARLAAAWPSGEQLADLPIAEDWRGAGTLRRKVDVEAFAARARAARNHPQSWALSSTLTDLAVDAAGEVAHARFDPPGPGPIKWLHHRLLKVSRHVAAPSAERLRASLLGEAERVQDNGLGFDHSRLASAADDGGRWTDPAVEVLAFFALALLPMRGRGTDRRVDPFAFVDQRQRGWRRMSGSREARRFWWPAWHQPLGADGIDALLDVWEPEEGEQWPLVGVHAGWRTVAFEPQGVDKTRAFGAERVVGVG